MTSQNDKTIELRIEEIEQQHVGTGRAVIDPKIIEDSKWNAGQILELVGSKKTYAKVWPGTVENYGTGIIRIDGTTRHNVGAGIGERVEVRAVDAKQAIQITLSATQKISGEGFSKYMTENYLNHVLTPGDVISANTQMGTRIQFVVTHTKPTGPVMVSEATAFVPGNTVQSVDTASHPNVTYDDLGGMKNEVLKMREIVELPMRHPELFEKIGIEAPKGVLLYGPPGTGKTLLAKALASETSAHFVQLSGPEIMAKHYGESEERIRSIFEEAQKYAPSIIFIDEIDAIAPKRDDTSGELEKRIVSQLLTLMDGIKSRGSVIVIAATNRPDSIDPALRRPGRFDREIEIGIPDIKGRQEILGIHTRGMPFEDKSYLKTIAASTHGFTGADLESLVKEAAMVSLRRVLPEINLDEERISSDALKKIRVSVADLKVAMREAHPSALREVLVQIPTTSWNDIGGNEKLKSELCESIEWPIKYKKAFQESGATAPHGILLHGPPGTGKTLAAKAVASTSGFNFISIKGSELLSKWVGESEKGVREIFRKARQAAPCIILFDEIDAIAPKRGHSTGSGVTDSVVSQLLTEIDGLEGLRDVLVMGATNRLDMIDAALLRPGRFDRIIEVPIPDVRARRQILEIHTRNKPLASDVDLDAVSKIADTLCGADLAELANIAAHSALRRHLINSSKNPCNVIITQNDLINASEAIQARLGSILGTPKPTMLAHA